MQKENKQPRFSLDDKDLVNLLKKQQNNCYSFLSILTKFHTKIKNKKIHAAKYLAYTNSIFN